MFDSYIKIKLDKESWKKVNEVLGKDNDGHRLGEKILKIHRENEELTKENKDLKKLLEKKSLTVDTLKESQEKIQKRYDKLEKKLASTKIRYKDLKGDYDILLKNPKIEERIVYKEDKMTLEAIRNKRDDLQKEVWELRRKLDHLNEERNKNNDRMEELEKKISDWQHRNFAILVEISPSQSQDGYLGIDTEIMDIDSYFEWKGRPGTFERKRGIKGSYSIKELRY